MTDYVRLPGLRCVRYEVALNGWRILKHTVNDFSLWRLIEYPWVTKQLQLKPGDLVFDIGTGTSSYPHMLAREGVNVVVLELEHERVRWQQQKYDTKGRRGDGMVYPVVADATALPLPDGTVQHISAISSLEHIPDDHAVGHEIGRVLAENGIVIITIPYTRSERTHFFEAIKPFRQVERNAFVQEGKLGSFFRFYNDQDIIETYVEPAHAQVTAWRGFGRRVLNGMYHETRCNRYWRRWVLKDWLLAQIVHPLEERFGTATEPLYVMFKMEPCLKDQGL
ncbi:MAG: methyltransferase domain-containing protein [Herpetosiphonaceae bacterium]|nr:methyltransferase domain-containing protein [Herpetosiphonaceae bacterium]